ncbi:MAG: hypothetical protein ACK5MQ_06465 [Pikeienuella sp.]
MALSPHPRVRLSRLRDIGWTLWDPIGLLGTNGRHPGRWDDAANEGFANEYDHYLIAAASQLRRGAGPEEVVDYLVGAETEDMLLRQSPDARARAEAVVAAILAEQDLWVWPDEQGRFR